VPYGSFECVIEIPTGYELSQAKATYQNGFLRVDVPLLVKASGKTTYVSISESK
jgi:HSP20 family molecular chaperone IbpA